MTSFHADGVRVRPTELTARDRAALGEHVESAGNRDPRRLSEPQALAEAIASAQRHLTLRRLAVFVCGYETGAPIVGLPFFARATLYAVDIEAAAGRDTTAASLPDEPLTSMDVPLGILGSDNFGFASFDLDVLRDAVTLSRLLVRLDLVRHPRLEVRLRLDLLPFADEQQLIDVLQAGDVGEQIAVIRYEPSDAELESRVFGKRLVSIQTPSLLDWRMSPSSFTTSAGHLLGEPGCEEFYPANLSTHAHSFHQTVKLQNTYRKLQGKTIQGKTIAGLSYGYSIEYRTEWFPIGHSLGQILYSLPLAPGEQVKLAIVDWSRSDSATRSEETGLTESLLHDQFGDRTISEIFYATVKEHQNGHSFMGGLSSSVAVPVGGAIIGGALGLGGASSSSSGVRDLTADTTQTLNDSFHQVSSAFRQLKSTVITQVNQTELGNFETRSVANYNHCHALTIVYYEVLRHYRVVTSVAKRVPVVLVDFAGRAGDGLDLSDESVVLARRAALESALLDARHGRGFDALSRKRVGQLALTEAAKQAATGIVVDRSELSFARFLVVLATGGNGTDGDVAFSLAMRDGSTVRCRQLEPPSAPDDFTLKYVGGDYDNREPNAVEAYFVEPERSVRWQDIRAALVTLSRNAGTAQGSDDWELDRLRLYGFGDNGAPLTLIDEHVRAKLQLGLSLPEVPLRPPLVDNEIKHKVPVLTDFVSADDLAAGELLLEHLLAHRVYYIAAAIAAEDPVDRREHFRAVEDAQIGNLADAIENRLVGNLGLEMAFPLREVAERGTAKVFGDVRGSYLGIEAEELVSVPTPGVFAEAKTGTCNSCERRDDSRFWQWDEAPIPGEPPEIGVLDTGTRFQQPANLAPTGLPASLINIVNPPAAPDPTALSASLGVLGQSDTFRDMSGLTQVESLLSSLSSSAAAAMTGLLKGVEESEGSPDEKAALKQKLVESGVKATARAPSLPGEDAQAQGRDGGGVTPPQGKFSKLGPPPSASMNRKPTKAKVSRYRKLFLQFESPRIQLDFEVQRLSVSSLADTSRRPLESGGGLDRNGALVVGGPGETEIPAEGSLDVEISFGLKNRDPGGSAISSGDWLLVFHARGSRSFRFAPGHETLSLMIAPEILTAEYTASDRTEAERTAIENWQHSTEFMASVDAAVKATQSAKLELPGLGGIGGDIEATVGTGLSGSTGTSTGGSEGETVSEATEQGIKYTVVAYLDRLQFKAALGGEVLGV